MGAILYSIAAILVVLWVVGFLFAHVAAPLIHLLLVGAVILFLVQLVTGRRTIV